MLTGMADADPRSEGPLETEPARSFGWWDMWVRPEDDPRTEEELTGERDTLVAYLRDRRLTLEMKCSGLDAAGLARRSVPPSDLSLLGLRAAPDRHGAVLVPRGDAPDRPGRATTAPRRTATPRSPARWPIPRWWPRPGRAGGPRWSSPSGWWRRRPTWVSAPRRATGFISMREVLVHMIEEYARHNGHADFLRERIDGRIGQ